MGAALSKTPDNPGLAVKNHVKPLPNPCWDGNEKSSGPRYLRVGYWITGLPVGRVSEEFLAIQEAWKRNGWQVDSSIPSVSKAALPDGYGLQLQDAGKGDGSLSLTGFSPCVPESTIAELQPDPTTIERPS
ncbi:hypothetical protein [Nocardia camponoti]|uniref:Uncharacterized protein n=1 Tax=Nocardia camponoti TaxID=1616106 RepID=A0A917VC77_9NOCA|nr:hypothetical protein [Nocardia camponoti]GGK61766.1 hypothetical protein GCM10011591_37560 [Nocardia camponoti]